MKDASSKMILSSDELSVIFHRICCQLIEEHVDFKSSALIGLQPRGVTFARHIHHILEESYGIKDLRYGELDTTFFRDDFRRRDAPLNPNQTAIDFLVEDAKVIFLDDVLFTGRSVRAAMDAVLSFGRPARIELVALIDRRFHRDLPVQANIIGKRIDSINKERVVVEWKEQSGKDQVMLTQRPMTDG
jgi:pyrimidine operon attenuation protein/uracil phosphoribosyltransferase